MSTEQQTFSVGDFTYTTDLHPPLEGFVILQALSTLGIEPLAEMVEGMLPPIARAVQDYVSAEAKAKSQPGGEAMSIMDIDLDVEGMLSGLELGAAAGRFSAALQRLDTSTIAKLLRYTNRDGKQLIDNAGQPTIHFNAAYRGNYGELMRACWEVARRNGFFGAWATSESGSGLWSDLAARFRSALESSSSEAQSAA